MTRPVGLRVAGVKALLTFGGFKTLGVALVLLVLTSTGARAASSRFIPPTPQLEGLVRQTHLDAAPGIHLVVELQPKDPSLDALAASILDPASPAHRATLSKAAFDERFGRSPAEIDGLVTWLHVHGAQNVYASSNRLVVGGDFTLDQAARALRTNFALYLAGPRRVIAPTTPLTIPVDGIRAVRGSISAFTPRLADTPTLPNEFRGAWFLPTRFREAYDAVDGGGAGMRVTLIEDASDAVRAGDVAAFLAADGAPPGASLARVTERVIVPPSPDAGCGRDDRGQEATIDVDAALTMAPGANVDVRYDQVCLRGSEGTLALQRALDDANAPNVIVFPFTVGPTYDAVATDWGPTSIPYLEAAVRGIPVVVPSGDDGAYGMREVGRDVPAIAYPCVLPVVICAGGTQLGTRSNVLDEGPWNDGVHASGGGISADPRPSWQVGPERFEFSPDYVQNRMVPDVSADASGHLQVFWRDYGIGGVGGTSESAAIVGAQIAAINAAVPVARRIAGAGDLYALARANAAAFRDVDGDNDRGYVDNTLHPRPRDAPRRPRRQARAFRTEDHEIAARDLPSGAGAQGAPCAPVGTAG